MNKGILGRSALFVLLSTVAAIPAYAQEPVATETAAEDRDEVIVVTANRREENLQDVSGVVQTLGADQLRRDGISELRQLQVAIPASAFPTRRAMSKSLSAASVRRTAPSSAIPARHPTSTAPTFRVRADWG
ncbi:hypothetical protein [Sphingopyxis sp.]|uniref:hypothetical protein n=1 Tax=Sphingopyxis sp. TaxID=1908224 RepID=UPI0025FBBDB8|nr:hypothetical protein [Sphingopyxis sp.]